MTENGPERWARLDELYHAALEQPEEQRDAFLRSACGGDEALRREVRALLGFHGREGFFDRPSAEIAARLKVAVEDPPPGEIRCPSCSVLVPAQSHFCLSCGHALSSLSQLPTATGKPVPQAAPAAAKGVGRLISSDSIPTGGFAPGVILVGRYRIIGLLGRGGMGEVYRGDDLKLGQPVALKFLPPALADDPVRRERFIAEVRITRGLAHPNICRVYDISELNGRYFLSMEFIDGEDLASLIKRIGYLSNEKALELARQLAAGLAAAHDRGVLHRDLKPANIMIDGHGRVRITDFGIAVAAGDETQAAQIYGTPAYMAPEQFAGKGASVRSDIYALGLILYEIYSGKKAFTAATIAELRAQKDSQTPTAPSEIRQGIDPIVERVIMRCLERDPRNRPASAAQLASALPGGDPLAAAIAAGETPSPEMVAASGLKEGLQPRVAWSLLAFTILAALVAIGVRGRTDLFQRLKPSKSPEALAERAREFVKGAGYGEEPADSVLGLKLDDDFQLFQNGPKNGSLPIPWKNLSSLSPVYFSYRQSPQPIEHRLFPIIRWTGNWVDPPVSLPGEIAVRLDTEGRLRQFRAVPPAITTSAGSARTPDWSGLFSAAGLNMTQWTPVEPRATPESFADVRAAWQGTFPDAPGIPILIEAAALQGKPVSFTVVYPWTELASTPLQRSTLQLLSSFMITGMFMIWVIGPIFWVRRNLRLGRGDRRGANRLVVALAIVPHTLMFLLWEHHVSNFWEVALFLMFAAGMTFAAGVFWMNYIAIEPFVRRRWPEILVSWTRALSGEWRDPVLGRDLLVGCAVGMAASCVGRLLILLSLWFGRPESGLLSTNTDLLLGTRSYIGFLVSQMPQGVVLPLALLFVYLFLRSLLRKEWLAAVAWVLTSPPDSSLVAAAGPWFAGSFNYFFTICALVLMRRLGIVAMAAYFFVGALFDSTPITFNNSWYAGYGYVSLALICALAVYAFRVSLGDRPLWSSSPVDAESIES
jgi:serine/threonine-protein kinase